MRVSRRRSRRILQFASRQGQQLGRSHRRGQGRRRVQGPEQVVRYLRCSFVSFCLSHARVCVLLFGCARRVALRVRVVQKSRATSSLVPSSPSRCSQSPRASSFKKMEKAEETALKKREAAAARAAVAATKPAKAGAAADDDEQLDPSVRRVAQSWCRRSVIVERRVPGVLQEPRRGDQGLRGRRQQGVSAQVSHRRCAIVCLCLGRSGLIEARDSDAARV